MGEPIPETPQNQQAALGALEQIGSEAINSEQQLYALCRQQNLTRNQAAFLKDALAGNGKVNGVPIGFALNTLQKHNPALAENPAALLNATQQLARYWPEGMTPNYKNVTEQAEGYASLHDASSGYQGLPGLAEEMRAKSKNMTPVGFNTGQNTPYGLPAENEPSSANAPIYYGSFNEMMADPEVTRRIEEDKLLPVVLEMISNPEQGEAELKRLEESGEISEFDALHMRALAQTYGPELGGTQTSLENRLDMANELAQSGEQDVLLVGRPEDKEELESILDAREAERSEKPDYQSEDEEFRNTRKQLKEIEQARGIKSDFHDNLIGAYDYCRTAGFSPEQAKEFILSNPEMASLTGRYQRFIEQSGGLESISEDQAAEFLNELHGEKGAQLVFPHLDENGNPDFKYRAELSLPNFMAGTMVGVVKSGVFAAKEVLTLCGGLISLAPMYAYDKATGSNTFDENPVIELAYALRYIKDNPEEFMDAVGEAFWEYDAQVAENGQGDGYKLGVNLGELLFAAYGAHLGKVGTFKSTAKLSKTTAKLSKTVAIKVLPKLDNVLGESLYAAEKAVGRKKITAFCDSKFGKELFEWRRSENKTYLAKKPHEVPYDHNYLRNPDSKTLVLGFDPHYARVAQQDNLAYFKINDRMWGNNSQTVNLEENMKVLRYCMENGYEIKFSNRPFLLRDETMFLEEVNFLKKDGYTFNLFSKKANPPRK